MCRRLTLVTTNNQSLITSLLEQLLSKAGSDVMPVVSAVLPLLKTSQRVRDTFVLVLRKALTKSDIYLRKMSVLGFLELLKNLKVSSLNALSQGSANCSSSTSSASSHFTQVCTTFIAFSTLHFPFSRGYSQNYKIIVFFHRQLLREINQELLKILNIICHFVKNFCPF